MNAFVGAVTGEIRNVDNQMFDDMKRILSSSSEKRWPKIVNRKLAVRFYLE